MSSTSPFVTWLANLSSAGSVTVGTDLLYISQGGASRKITPFDFIFGRANTFTAAQLFSANGAASTPAAAYTGTWFTGGSTTTTKPQFLVEPSGTTSTGWSTSGTGIGVNAPSGFVGNLLDLQLNGTSIYKWAASGSGLTVGGSWADFTINCPSGGGSRFFTIAEAGAIRLTIALGQISGQSTFALSNDNPAAPDVYMRRDAANTLARRNGTSAQTDHLYGTYTDGSNYRRVKFTMSTAGVAEIKPEGSGTGAAGNVLQISGLPTSNPGPGILWNNAGTPAIGT